MIIETVFLSMTIHKEGRIWSKMLFYRTKITFIFGRYQNRVSFRTNENCSEQ